MRAVILLFLFSFFMLPSLLSAQDNGMKLPEIKKPEVKAPELKKPEFKMPKDTMKPKLLKKLAAALNIPKKLKAKEEKRVLDVITKVLAKDSVLVTLTNIKNLNAALAVKQKQQFDTLIKLITKLSKQIPKSTPPPFSDDFSADGDEPAAEEGFDPDKDMDALVAKMVPILKQKAEDEKADEQLQQKLKAVRELLSNGGQVQHTVQANDSTFKRYTLKLTRKVPIFGYHPYWMKDHYLNYNFNLLSTLAFYAYELDPKTGGYVSVNGWDTAGVVNAAQAAGCRVVLVVHCDKNAAAFLKSGTSQNTFIATVLQKLSERKANGINIFFDGMSAKQRNEFTAFIEKLSPAMKKANRRYQLTVTLPAIDQEPAYDIAALNPLVDQFIIDFTKKTGAAPLAPLAIDSNSLKSAIGRYLNKSIPAQKFMACMPYYGVRWQYKKTLSYISYDKVRSQYAGMPVTYDATTTARIDSLNELGDTVVRIWYDDDKTLAAKYDYILQRELGGVAIWALGYDNNHAELWNTLMDKLVQVDTVRIDTIHVARPAKLTLWQQIKKELRTYKLLLTDPCHVNLKDIKGDDVMGPVALVLLVLLVIVAVLYIYNIKTVGDDWKPRKIVLKILIALVILTLLSIFLYLFLNKEFTLIGVTDGTCNPVSFNTVISIISVGFVCGLLVMRFLIFPLIRKEDIP